MIRTFYEEVGKVVVKMDALIKIYARKEQRLRARFLLLSVLKMGRKKPLPSSKIQAAFSERSSHE